MKREWVPAEYVDEWTPPGHGSPDDFIVREGDGFILGYLADAKGINDEERRQFNRAIVPGDIVTFMFVDHLGEIEVAFRPDRTFDVKGVVPDEANWFWIAGTDICGDSLEELAAQVREDAAADGATDTVRMMRQGDEIPFKLVLGGEDRAARFEQVSTAEVRQ